MTPLLFWPPFFSWAYDLGLSCDLLEFCLLGFSINFWWKHNVQHIHCILLST